MRSVNRSGLRVWLFAKDGRECGSASGFVRKGGKKGQKGAACTASQRGMVRWRRLARLVVPGEMVWVPAVVKKAGKWSAGSRY